MIKFFKKDKKDEGLKGEETQKRRSFLFPKISLGIFAVSAVSLFSFYHFFVADAGTPQTYKLDPNSGYVTFTLNDGSKRCIGGGTAQPGSLFIPNNTDAEIESFIASVTTNGTPLKNFNIPVAYGACSGCDNDGTHCGDGQCNCGETYNTCGQDCGGPPQNNCGDGQCLGQENHNNCPQDC